MAHAALQWGRFAWRAGADEFSFEIEPGGMYATLRPPQPQSALTLPVVAWEGLLEAMKVNRSARQRAQGNLPPRAGARWSEEETQRLMAAFGEGKSVAALSQIHARTSVAIESQLVRLGLIARTDPSTSGQSQSSATQSNPMEPRQPDQIYPPQPVNEESYVRRW